MTIVTHLNFSQLFLSDVNYDQINLHEPAGTSVNFDFCNEISKLESYYCQSRISVHRSLCQICQNSIRAKIYRKKVTSNP